MPANIISTRIQSKYDTLNNWIASAQGATPFIPLKGEICIVEIPSTNTAAQTQSNGQSQMTPPAIAIKVGDGTHNFLGLPWIQGIAGDVYSWAKAVNKPTYTGNEISTTRKDSANPNNETLWTHPSVESWLQALTNDINALSGGSGSISTQIANALADLDVDNDSTSANFHHITGFGRGKTLATLTEEDGYIAATFQDILITNTQVSGLGSAATSNVANAAITDNDTGSELPTKAQVASYVASKTAGLTGAMHYQGAVSANPTTTAPTGTYAAGDVVTFGNAEFVYDGSTWRELGTEGSYALSTIQITGSDGLTGGGTLSENRTITHSVPTGASASTRGTSGGRTYIQTLTTDKFGHVTGVATATETVTDTTYTFAEGSTNGAFSVTPTEGPAQTVSIHGLGDAAYANIASAIDNTTNANKLVTAGQVDARVGTLENIAHSGSIYDVVEHYEHDGGTNENYSFLVFNCGTASELIDSIS